MRKPKETRVAFTKVGTRRREEEVSEMKRVIGKEESRLKGSRLKGGGRTGDVKGELRDIECL